MKTFTIYKVQSHLLAFFFFLFLSVTANAQWSQLGSDIDGEATNDQSGHSVSMNAAGDRLAIGAPNNDGNGSDAGHVRVYEWIGLAWVQMGADIDGEAADNQYGISVSMNDSGNRLAIGGNLNDGNGLNSGHVRIFEWDTSSTTWVQMGADIDGEAANDNSGIEVNMNSKGDRVAIGAGSSANGVNSGHVRIFEWDTTLISWVQFGGDIDGEAAGDASGRAISMNGIGDRVAIGAYRNSGSGPNAGHVRIYEWDTTITSWKQMGLDIDGEANFDYSGISVDMNTTGDLIVIGASGNSGSSGSGSRAGHARTYSWNGTVWAQVGLDIDGEAIGDAFGISASMNSSGDRIAVGAWLNDGNGGNSGHVRVYEWNSRLSIWDQITPDIDGESKDDASGLSTCMNASGDRIAIGAPANDGNGLSSGHVRIYEYSFLTDLNENISLKSFSIYPNPTKGELTIETNNSIGEIIQITSITGAVLKEISISQNRELIDLSGFENGLYFLKCKNISQKIILIN